MDCTLCTAPRRPCVLPLVSQLKQSASQPQAVKQLPSLEQLTLSALLCAVPCRAVLCRAVQVYGGVVYMDFDKDHMQAHGCGSYQSLDPKLLPRLWLVCSSSSPRCQEIFWQQPYIRCQDNMRQHTHLPNCVQLLNLHTSKLQQNSCPVTPCRCASAVLVCACQLPQVYCDNPSDSGKVHSSVKQRWLDGDPQVVQGMRQVAACAEQGRCVRAGE